MARISYSELVELVTQSPRYRADFAGDVPAEQSMRIVFGEQSALKSEVFTSGTGIEVILDVDKDGKVWGIELY